ncbi:uncharacterized protein DUF397 [Streptomyces sp. Amel2xB2]|uniref:DUF397 domain-containing protein n=1 Tax=Streptomyces sp. Amel2xB2 TaxID=1305829 RepID=UPI000DB9AF4B|nr:DUF397 domain-containing protein [Streptomyces sp. Amel2xB2]RAJ71803.1 uncharacterized protein DUF397 [Streptomyces sp. Amel2xB2]
MSYERVWFKSSYSNTEGGNCLEVALTWRKSSRSNSEGGECAEVAACPCTVHVRDSKQGRTGPQLAFPVAAWSAFLRSAERSRN